MLNNNPHRGADAKLRDKKEEMNDRKLTNGARLTWVQIPLAIIGGGIASFFLAQAGIGQSGLVYALRGLWFPNALISIAIYGSLGLIFNRGSFVGFNYFIAGMLISAYGFLMAWRHSADPQVLPSAFAVAALPALYGSCILLIAGAVVLLRANVRSGSDPRGT